MGKVDHICGSSDSRSPINLEKQYKYALRDTFTGVHVGNIAVGNKFPRTKIQMKGYSFRSMLSSPTGHAPCLRLLLPFYEPPEEASHAQTCQAVNHELGYKCFEDCSHCTFEVGLHPKLGMLGYDLTTRRARDS